jgi:hypothetical protein
MSLSSSQGTQCVHQDFSSCRRHAYIRVERIHVRIPGHTGRILGSYLHISVTAFEFCRDDATRESYVAALFDCSSIQNIQVYSTLIDKNLPPDGSNDSSRILFAFIVCYKTSSGARSVLSMIVAPEAIVEYFRV